MRSKNVLTCAFAAAAIGAAAHAQTPVTTNISTSTTWTVAGSPYNLVGQIYVLPGATLTIDPGVVVASLPVDQGSLAVCRGAQIFVNGTAQNPVIMTSTNDTATWVGGNPKTGTWREAANEWGNLTIMGAAYISENCGIPNTAAPNPANKGVMEGLVLDPGNPTRIEYGGGNDDDDSGSISYLSLRYGGKVIGLANELNALSLGGIGRNTEIHHVDIMNNVDDGIEIWGGTVNIKHFNIWNVGDDSFDVDQGWRGKAQFGLIVQGHSLNAAQGSGVGDNVFETDGAEDANYQPVTTAAIYNVTMIGQPDSNGGDHATAWRDNARIQYNNCIFMDMGEEVVRLDNSDGDAPCPGSGYGFGGTLTWAQTWVTAFNAVPAHANDFTTGTYATNYPAQTSGFLAQIVDSVFFRNLNANAYTTANAVNVFAPANNNVLIPGFNPADAPIQSITRGPLVVRGGKNILPVIALDPRPANAALASVNAAPADGFFTPAAYRGAFAPGAQSWLCDWTASFAFGFTNVCDPGESFCFGDNLDPNVTTDCPCANFGAAGRGCASSFNANGIQVTASGVVANDNVVLSGNGMQATGICVFIQGTAIDPNGFVFGDGVTCTGGSILRLRGVALSGGNASFPVPPETITLSQRGGVTVGSGAIRSYSVFYRNAAAAFCPPATFNISQSYRIIW